MGRSFMFGLALIVILLSICMLIWIVNAIRDDETAEDGSALEQVEDELEDDLLGTQTTPIILVTSVVPTSSISTPAAPAAGQGGAVVVVTPQPTIAVGVSVVTPAVVAPVVALPANCQVRTDWQTYVVQAGDIFATIAESVGVTLDELNAGNCLPNVDNIYVGQVLRVPALPANYVVATLPAVGQGGAVQSTTGITTIVIAPSLGFADNIYTLGGGNAVTISWLDVPTTAVSVSFFYQDVDDVTPALITEDNDLLDGANIAWTVPDDTNGIISAVALLQNGTEVRSQIVSVFAQ